MEQPLIEFKDVTKRFGPRTVLDRVNLQIFEGQVTTIIGLSGAGKSVLIKHIIGLLRPDEGQILFRGKPLGEMSKAEMDECRAGMSYMFQDNALFDSMSVYDNVALPLRETTNLKKAEIDRRVMARLRSPNANAFRNGSPETGWRESERFSAQAELGRALKRVGPWGLACALTSFGRRMDDSYPTATGACSRDGSAILVTRFDSAMASSVLQPRARNSNSFRHLRAQCSSPSSIWSFSPHMTAS